MMIGTAPGGTRFGRNLFSSAPVSLNVPKLASLGSGSIRKQTLPRLRGELPELNADMVDNADLPASSPDLASAQCVVVVGVCGCGKR